MHMHITEAGKNSESVGIVGKRGSRESGTNAADKICSVCLDEGKIHRALPKKKLPCLRQDSGQTGALRPIHLHLADLSDRLKDRMQYSKRGAFLSIDETPELSPAPARCFVQLVKRPPMAAAAQRKTAGRD